MRVTWILARYLLKNSKKFLNLKAFAIEKEFIQSKILKFSSKMKLYFKFEKEGGYAIRGCRLRRPAFFFLSLFSFQTQSLRLRLVFDLASLRISASLWTVSLGEKIKSFAVMRKKWTCEPKNVSIDRRPLWVRSFLFTFSFFPHCGDI